MAQNKGNANAPGHKTKHTVTSNAVVAPHRAKRHRNKNIVANTRVKKKLASSPVINQRATNRQIPKALHANNAIFVGDKSFTQNPLHMSMDWL